MNHPSKKAAATLPLVRCAIYTRKSTEEGLEQEFNSLDAQRESATAFIRSQTHEGWTCLPQRYDDGGFTGGNMERPALQRLSVGQLRQRFAELFGEATHASNRTWLIKRIAGRMQALAEGDLTERATTMAA